jgi:nitroimidazol reductase NimA-like FMN-containing flavoprotein (pyridoxamine 5'-phosphate oxidase superfamily)
MRRNEREITDTAQIEALLQRARICRVGFSDGDSPYVVPVCFGYRNRTLYFHCAAEGYKLDILRRNPRVCIEAEADVAFVPHDRPCGWSLKYRSVVGFGSASIVEDPEAKREGLGILMAHYAQGPFVFPGDMLARTEVVRIDIESMTGKQCGYGGNEP